MNRTIKFRAWNPDNPNVKLRMVENPLHRCDASNVLENKGIYANWILMQFTGLKDKNGKEIYESDIVEWTDTSDGIDRGWKRTAIVRISPDIYFECFKIGDKSANHKFHFGNFIYTDTENHLTIVGNVYQPPELLNPQQP